MPPYLVITHIGRLNAALGTTGTWNDVNRLLTRRYGRYYWVLDFEARLNRWGYDFHQAYDALMAEVNALGRPNYIIIMGGPDVVPFSIFHNACFGLPYEDEFLLSDDLYGDLAHEDWYLPEVGVARVPDGGDFKLIQAIFRANDAPEPVQHDVFAYAQPFRPWAWEMVQDILWDDPAHPDARSYPIWSYPQGPGDLTPAQTNARWSWYMLHGGVPHTDVWKGQGPQPRDYPVAITVNEAESHGLVVSSACYGAFISHRSDLSEFTPDPNNPWPQDARKANNSVALHFLQSGAFAFIGHTSIGHSATPDISEEVKDLGPFTIYIPPRNIDGGQQHFVALVFEKAAWQGWHPLDAFRQAKWDYMPTLYPGPGVPRCGEKKAQNDFVYYGLPPRP
jgi:hypothetical protein